jgi:anti-sigma factor ChrR (cupin superfamily)
MRIVTRQKTNKGTPPISYMIQERLRARTLNESTIVALSPHPDEDTICAFVEARLESDESLPVISHLIACGVCRRATAELVRLESQIDESDDSTLLEESPGRLRAILDSISSSITPSITPPSLEDSVYGYQLPETDEEQDATTESATDVESPKKDEESPQ